MPIVGPNRIDSELNDRLEPFYDQITVTMCAINKMRSLLGIGEPNEVVEKMVRFCVKANVGVVKESVNSRQGSTLFCIPVCNGVYHASLVLLAPNIEVIEDEEKIPVVTVGPSFFYRETFPIFAQQNNSFFDLQRKCWIRLSGSYLKDHTSNRLQSSYA